MIVGSASAADICQNPEYETGGTQLEVGPFTLMHIAGFVDDRTVRIPQHACIRVFTSNAKKFVAGMASDAKGEFSFSGIESGNYRVVVSCDHLCTTSFEVRLRNSGNKKKIAVHMLPRGLDSCSFAELK
jgi:hypothetical protein